ncbi:adenylate kinase [Spiroplasma endosymbiont of Amphibalanus improvisus]|uniref:adenylate kinase n=1 Tax=Spiroplasma endosymbiont of Amphibalanus improvisus TaxID=3066327 RepID=UPI00313BE6AF
MENNYNVILLGPPGSGKGTLSKEIVEHFKFNHLSTGDLIRSYIKKETPLSIKLNKVLESGELLSDNLMIQMVEERLKTFKNGVIWDGFPRTLEQAYKLDELLTLKKQKINAVILLKVSEEIIIERISLRLLCPNCNAIYNSKLLPPKNLGICDICQNKLIRRSDDDPEKIQIRLSEYKAKTKPLIDFYKKQNKLFEIDSTTSIQQMLKTFKGIKNDND